MYVSVFIDVSISVYFTSLFVGDVNPLLMVSTKTTEIEPPRNIMMSQYSISIRVIEYVEYFRGVAVLVVSPAKHSGT